MEVSLRPRMRPRWRRALLLTAATTALLTASVSVSVAASPLAIDDDSSDNSNDSVEDRSNDYTLEDLARQVFGDSGSNTKSSSNANSGSRHTTTTKAPATKAPTSFTFGDTTYVVKPAPTRAPATKKPVSTPPTRRASATPTPTTAPTLAPMITAEAMSVETPLTVKPAGGDDNEEAHDEAGSMATASSTSTSSVDMEADDIKVCPKYNEITSACGGVCGNNVMCIKYRSDGECVKSDISTCTRPAGGNCDYECLDGTSSEFDQWYISPVGVPAWNTTLHNNKQIEAMRLVNVPRNITQLSVRFAFNELNGVTIKGKVATIEFPDKRIVSADSTLSSMAFVNVDFSKIPDAVFTPRLQNLVLNNCLLKEMPAVVLKAKNLNYLDMTSNYINKLPQNITSLPIAGIYLDDNEMTALPGVLSMSTLKVLSLVGNNISSVTVDARNSALNELALDYNLLTDFNGNIPSLHKLYLRGNRLTGFPKSLTSLTNLEILDLTENALSSQAIDEATLTHPNLNELMLGSNGLHNVPDLGNVFPSLATLWVRNNSIEKVEGSYSGKIETLKAFSNKIKEFTASFTRLISLDLSDNKLENLPKISAISPVLSSLNVSANQIKELSQDSVLSGMTLLNASSNSISSFTLQMPNLRVLDLSNNKLSKFPDAVWTYYVLDALYLDGNSDLKDLQFTRDQYVFLKRLSTLTLDEGAIRSDCPDTWKTKLGLVTLCVEQGVQDVSVLASSNSTSHPWAWISLAIGLVALVVVVAFVVVMRRRRALNEHHYDPHQGLTTGTLKPEDRTMGLTGSSLGFGSLMRSNPNGIWDDEELRERRVDFDSIKLESKLAAGAFGEVWIGTYRLECVAVKKLSDAGMRDKNALAYFVSEIKLLAQLDHPRIIRFYGVAWTCLTDLCAVIEFMPGGDLHSMLWTSLLPSTRWTAAKLQIALDTVEALTYVHTLDDVLIHRDLKSRNVLLDDDWRAKVTDFGISRFQREGDATMTSGIGTGRWMAPEVIMGRADYTEKVDIYSFGVILSELDTHQMPYSVPTAGQQLPHSEMGILQQVAAGELTPGFSPTCPASILEVAQKCLAFRPEDRPSSLEVAYMLRQLIPMFPREDAPRPSSMFSRGTFTMQAVNPFRKSSTTTTQWRGGSEIQLRSSATQAEFSL